MTTPNILYNVETSFEFFSRQIQFFAKKRIGTLQFVQTSLLSSVVRRFMMMVKVGNYKK